MKEDDILKLILHTIDHAGTCEVFVLARAKAVKLEQLELVVREKGNIRIKTKSGKAFKITAEEE